jgi:SAM-dependent methyltransferase
VCLSRSSVRIVGVIRRNLSKIKRQEPLMLDPEELPVLEGYDAWAPLYDSDGNPLTAIEEPVMQAWYGPIEERKVLDLGCGTGRHTLSLARAGALLTAVDGSDEMLARARVKLDGFDVNWSRHLFPDPLPFENDTFDLIVLGLVAEHIDDLRALLLEAVRVAKPGGRCLLSSLHPDRTSNGQKARFIDPATGLRKQIRTIHRTIEETLEIARSSGWTLEAEQTLIVPIELGQTLPRALPYVGQKLGWAAHWRKA